MRLLVIAALGWIAGDVSAQAPTQPRVVVPYDGPEIFARLLDHAGLRPLKSLDELDRHAAEAIVIVFGDPAPLLDLEARRGGLAALLQSGASLCIATDHEFDFDALSSLRWKLRIDGATIVDRRHNFEGYAPCPLVWIDDLIRKNHPPIFDGVDQLAANAPSQFLSSERAPEILAFFCQGSVAEARSSTSFFGGLFDRFAFHAAIRGSVPKAEHRVLLLAGHGVFMNCMTIQDDTKIQNRRFALNVIRWLAHDDGARKKYALFYHEGKVRTDFKVPLIGPPTLPLPSAAALNKIIDAVQKEAMVQRLIDQNVGPEPILRGLIVFGTLTVLVYGLKRFFQSRHAPERTPLLVGVPDARTTPLTHQQMREVTSRNRLGEPAQALAQAWFRDVAKIDPAAPAAYEVNAGYFARRKLLRQVDEVWQLARGTPVAHWSRARLLELGRTLEDLTVALLAGEVRFVSSGTPAGS